MPKPKQQPSRAARRESVETEDFTVDLGEKSQKRRPPPKVEESPPFLFTHHHEAYTVQGGEVIPRLGKLKLLPGVNGVEEDPKTGRIIAGAAINEAREKGLVIIPHDVDGPGTTYLCRPKGCPGVHLSRFEKVYPGSSKIDCDEAAYVEWCRSLVQRGLVPAAPAYILERMRADLIRQLEDLEDKRGVDSIRKRLARDLDAVERELAALPVDDEPLDVEPAPSIDLGRGE